MASGTLRLALASAVAATLLVPTGATAAAPVRPHATVCDTYCGGRDPALAASDRTPVTATVWSRTIVLHADDMMWASIDNGNPGDEVWLDRSFHGGRTWSSGSKLGDTTVPDGSRGWRTLMRNADDWNNRGIGALRACGKAGDRDEIACTEWRVPPRTRRTAGAPPRSATTRTRRTCPGRRLAPRQRPQRRRPVRLPLVRAARQDGRGPAAERPRPAQRHRLSPDGVRPPWPHPDAVSRRAPSSRRRRAGPGRRARSSPRSGRPRR